LSQLMLTLNLLAFLFHTVLEMMDKKYELIRSDLPTRQTFFDDIRALTRYLYFESWDEAVNFYDPWPRTGGSGYKLMVTVIRKFDIKTRCFQGHHGTGVFTISGK